MPEHNFCVDWERFLRNQHNVWGAVTEAYGQDADFQNLKLYSVALNMLQDQHEVLVLIGPM